jgi:hypothetical protein
MTLSNIPMAIQDAAEALTPKQLAFVHRYQEIGNKVQAYIDCYSWTGSYHAAQVEAYWLSRHAATITPAPSRHLAPAERSPHPPTSD